MALKTAQAIVRTTYIISKVDIAKKSQITALMANAIEAITESLV
jgi:hypothetical protein